MAEPWCPQPAPDNVGAIVEPRCSACGFPLGRDGACPWHGVPADTTSNEAKAAA